MVRCRPDRGYLIGNSVMILSGPFTGRSGKLHCRTVARPDVPHNIWKVVVDEDTITVSQDCLSLLQYTPAEVEKKHAPEEKIRKKKMRVLWRKAN